MTDFIWSQLFGREAKEARETLNAVCGEQCTIGPYDPIFFVHLDEGNYLGHVGIFAGFCAAGIVFANGVILRIGEEGWDRVDDEIKTFWQTWSEGGSR